MSYEQRDNSGTLGKNERREKDTHPEYSGQCVINGQPMWISAWVKEGRNGKFFSLSFRPKQARQIQGAVAHKEPDRGFDDDSSIPF